MKKSYIIMMVAAGAMLAGCKPTEKNYKAAYDAALSKRQTEDLDPDLNLPREGMHRFGEPVSKEINGKEVMYQFVRLKALEDSVRVKRYNVALSVYKMSTNCRAQVSDLRKAGYDAFGAVSGDDRYYVIAGTFGTIDEAAGFSGEYAEKNPEVMYVGFGNGPVVIESY